MAESYELAEADWSEVTRAGAEGVESHVLVPLEEGGLTRVGVTRIAAGGVYGVHVDDYAHVFSVLEGQGEAEVGEERVPLEPGVILRTQVNEPHGLRAAGDRPLVLLTMSLYPDG